jgi:hypothetical protein
MPDDHLLRTAVFLQPSVKKKRQAAGRYINTDRRLLIAGTALALANSRNLSEMVVRMQLATACLMMGSYMSYS